MTLESALQNSWSNQMHKTKTFPHSICGSGSMQIPAQRRTSVLAAELHSGICMLTALLVRILEGSYEMTDFIVGEIWIGD